MSSTTFYKRIQVLHDGPFFKRHLPSPPDWIKRLETGGCFVPDDSHIKDLMTWAEKHCRRVLATSTSNIVSPLNTFDDFYGMAILAISHTLSRYCGFYSEEEFWSLLTSAVRNKCQDHIRNLLRRKRFAFQVPLEDESNDDGVVSTVASVSGGGSRQIPDSLIVDPVYPDDFHVFLSSSKQLLSEEALKLLSLLKKNPDDADSLRETHVSEFEELQHVFQDFSVNHV